MRALTANLSPWIPDHKKRVRDDSGKDVYLESFQRKLEPSARSSNLGAMRNQRG